MTNNAHTTSAHGVIKSKLDATRKRLAELKAQQQEIDMEIEDCSRLELALARAEATLAVALTPKEPALDPETVELLHDQALALEQELANGNEAA